MKILYVTENSDYDYLRDSIFIGLVNNGHEVTDSRYLWMMGPITKEEAKNTYCKGFTYGNVLSGDRKDIYRGDIEEKIKSHYYDLVVYGSIRRCLDYFNIVTKVYKREEIILLDGEDDQRVDNVLAMSGVYFKREMISDSNHCLPISFSIPKSKLCYWIATKTKDMAFITPFDKSTYIYTEEEDYYNDYRESLFAETCRKGGWDCLRHYEIVGNKCLPYFHDYDGKPPYTMTTWPSDLQAEANYLFRWGEELGDNATERAFKVIAAFYDYTANNLTCEKVAENMLKRI